MWDNHTLGRTMGWDNHTIGWDNRTMGWDNHIIGWDILSEHLVGDIIMLCLFSHTGMIS